MTSQKRNITKRLVTSGENSYSNSGATSKNTVKISSELQ